MKKSKFFPSIILAVSSLMGCATPYVGPSPNLDLKGEAATAEYRRFEMRDDFLGQGNDFRMGPEGTRYTIESVEPIVRTVSPRAGGKIESYRSWRRAQDVAFYGALAFVAGAFASKEGSSARNGFSVAAIATGACSVGFGMTAYAKLSSAAGDFNDDLRARLTPGAAVSFAF